MPIALEAGKCGAYAFIEKNSDIEPIISILKEAIETRQQAALLNPLSHQQLETLRLSACGMDRTKIAGTMGISKRTVKLHLLNAVKKLLFHIREMRQYKWYVVVHPHNYIMK